MHTKQSVAVVAAIVVLLVWTLVVAVSFCLMPHHDGLYFRNPVLNALALFSAFLAPTLILIFLAAWTTNPIFRLVLAAVIFPFAAGGLLMDMFLSFDIQGMLETGSDSSYELIHSAQLGSVMLAAYRTNGGAMTDFGVSIEKQYLWLPGLKWVKHVDGEYHADDVQFTRISDKQICCKFHPTRPGIGREILVGESL